MKIKHPKKRYNISIDIKANTKDELWIALEKCLMEIKKGFSCVSSGGDFKTTEYSANYEQFPNKTPNEWMKERELFADFMLDKLSWEHNWKSNQIKSNHEQTNTKENI
jgi:hypothetical protein